MFLLNKYLIVRACKKINWNILKILGLYLGIYPFQSGGAIPQEVRNAPLTEPKKILSGEKAEEKQGNYWLTMAYSLIGCLWLVVLRF